MKYACTKIILLSASFFFYFDAAAQPAEPYRALHGGAYTGRRIPASPDPLVHYQWNHPVADDALQLYTLHPRKINIYPAAAFSQSNQQITVNSKGTIMLDFGVESAGWLEFESADCTDSLEAAISEYNEPAIVNEGAQHPVKMLRPVKYGKVYRLELNDQLYEGVRFAWIIIKNVSHSFHIKNIQLVCQVKPVNYRGSFSCNDTMLNRIWYTGAYVVKLNMLQDYFGAILMERSDRHSWTGDAYPAQAAALAAFGNYDVIKKNIDFTSGQNNGIAAYSVYWVLSLLDYYHYTGDSAFLRKYFDNADKRLREAYAHYDVLPSLGFMGWDERLGAGFENTQIAEAQNTYRMLCIHAWKRFSEALLTINEKKPAAVYQQFADEKIQQLKSANQLTGQYSVHALSEAIQAGLLNEPAIRQLSNTLYADRLNRLSYSPFNQCFIIQAMAIAGKFDEALTTIKDCWGGQISYGGTSFFEVYRPSWNEILKQNDAPPNNQCGYTSLAHPWGAGVTQWLSENILGIQPITPGFKTFTVIPELSGGLTRVSGSMPTNFGLIESSFDIEKGAGTLIVPPGTTAVKWGIPKAGRQIKKILVNNKLYQPDTEDKQFVYCTNIKPGKYDIRVAYADNNRVARIAAPAFSYPVNSFQQDSVTGGNWKTVYGKDGFVLFGKYPGGSVQQLPAYISSVATKNGGSVVWDSASTDKQVLQQPVNGNSVATAMITKDPLATLQTMTVDIDVQKNHSCKLSLYLLDYDKKDRRTAIELFDLHTLNILAPVQMIRTYENGKYLSFIIDRPVRVRINQVRGKNAAVSGLFFDKE